MGGERIKNPEAKLVEAAIQIIQTNGLENLNFRNIATKANCSIGSLYNYFQNMNELILKINAKTLLQFREVIKRAASSSDTKQSFAKALAKEYLNFAQQNLPFWDLLFKYKIPKDQDLPKWFNDIIEDNFTLLESALQPYVDPKQVRKASRILWGGSQGIILLAIKEKQSFASIESPESLCEAFFENYLRGCESFFALRSEQRSL